MFTPSLCTLKTRFYRMWKMYILIIRWTEYSRPRSSSLLTHWTSNVSCNKVSCSCLPWPMLYFVLDTWMAWVRLLSAMWTPILLEPSCHDGPTPTGSQAAPLSLLWTCSMWPLQCRSGLHSCNGFWIWCACLWSMPLWTQRHGVSTIVCGFFSGTITLNFNDQGRKHLQSFLSHCFGIFMGKVSRVTQNILRYLVLLNVNHMNYCCTKLLL